MRGAFLAKEEANVKVCIWGNKWENGVRRDQKDPRG